LQQSSKDFTIASAKHRSESLDRYLRSIERTGNKYAKCGPTLFPIGLRPNQIFAFASVIGFAVLSGIIGWVPLKIGLGRLKDFEV